MLLLLLLLLLLVFLLPSKKLRNYRPAFRTHLFIRSLFLVLFASLFSNDLYDSFPPILRPFVRVLEQFIVVPTIFSTILATFLRSSPSFHRRFLLSTWIGSLRRKISDETFLFLLFVHRVSSNRTR